MRSLGEIITKHRKKMGYSQVDISKMLGTYGINITNKAVSSWEKDVAEPSCSVFLLLCKILNITDIYGDRFGENPDNPLSILNEEGKAKAIEYIDLLKKSGMYEPEPIKQATIISFRRNIKLFDIPASAGTGSFLDSEDFTMLEVGEEVPAEADFGIRISGDSMEPQFINGQIVWIHQQETLSDGEIGIFFLDGDAYCKKLKDDADGLYLVSLNKKYDPIPIKEETNFKVFGKVVG